MVEPTARELPIRARRLRAVRSWDGEKDETRSVTMADPEGDALCISSARRQRLHVGDPDRAC
jgi:hypothetical protein